ncbi:hypothetical protein AB0K80_32705 [Streptomyces sp. NPDC052682]|uniref:hypothetical protein n=1 Tax=Streptomyces sp. NPDC052682 TaxID=3154954 RepID=UPI0034396E8C
MPADVFPWADLLSPGTPGPASGSGHPAATDRGTAPGPLGDATAWTLFGMIFDSVTRNASSRARASGGVRPDREDDAVS